MTIRTLLLYPGAWAGIGIMWVGFGVAQIGLLIALPFKKLGEAIQWVGEHTAGWYLRDEGKIIEIGRKQIHMGKD